MRDFTLDGARVYGHPAFSTAWDKPGLFVFLADSHDGSISLQVVGSVRDARRLEGSAQLLERIWHAMADYEDGSTSVSSLPLPTWAASGRSSRNSWDSLDRKSKVSF